jgi:acyl dehydratase
MHKPLFFDDLSIGDIFESLSKTITEAEIIDYAWRYDPQPFHVSKPEATKSIFGGLIASGFMTAAITFRLIQQSNGFQTTSSGGHGINKLRWLEPVRPNDTINATMNVLSLKLSVSNPKLGNVLCKFDTFNQNKTIVMTMENIWILKRSE